MMDEDDRVRPLVLMSAEIARINRELTFVKTERDGLAVVVQQRENELHEARAALRVLRDGGKPGE